jgi:hypothetical protein
MRNNGRLVMMKNYRRAVVLIEGWDYLDIAARLIPPLILQGANPFVIGGDHLWTREQFANRRKHRASHLPLYLRLCRQLE